MRLANEVGLIACLSHEAAKEITSVPLNPVILVVGRHTVKVRLDAGYECASSWNTDRAVGVGPVESRPHPGQPIQTVGAHTRMSGAPQGVTAMLIGSDENNVGSILHENAAFP